MDLDTLVFPEYQYLIGKSTRTGNSDDRANPSFSSDYDEDSDCDSESDHSDPKSHHPRCTAELDLPAQYFHYEIYSSKGITLRHFIETVYRLKTCKFDVWYELFCGFDNIKFGQDPDGNLKYIPFYTQFDYGS